MALNFINTSGNIISEDFCSQLLSETKAAYVKSKSFGDDVRKVDEDIATSFELLRESWEGIRTKVIGDEFDNSQLRDKWIKPFFELLGFEPVYIPHNLKNDAGIEYRIPYKGWDADEAPLIHMVHSSHDLDARNKNNATHPNKSPHDILQQYLNSTKHTWGIVTNGKKIRILRDFFHSITKGFIEFDIESIFESASTEDFRVLYRLMHKSRFIGQYETEKKEDAVECLLEKFHSLSRETGVKVGENLRKQVRSAIEALGNGFAENLNVDDFNEEEEKKFYSEILNIIYRLLFLLFAEQKGWLPVKNQVYARTYSVDALRERAEKADYSYDNNEDLWEGLKLTFKLLTNGYTFPNGDKINAFGGQLFSDERIYHIKSPLKNKHLLKAIDALSFFTDNKIRNKINYARLAIDELGSVYESLLDYEPRLLKENTEINNKIYKRGEFILDDRSTERKTTGSYYTDSRLVAQLIDSALVPVIENAINEKDSDDDKRQAILNLKVADIACGSGAFLIAALEKMGEYLALIGKEEWEKPAEEELRQAKRLVLQNCIYGVDLNPMALELAKFSLWITASMPDMPLNFLDHKLKCGNSLIGATPELIKKGIPEEAYNPVTLDNKEICKQLKLKVRKELRQKETVAQESNQLQLAYKDHRQKEQIEERRKKIYENRQNNVSEVNEAEEEYLQLVKEEHAFKEWLLADVWTAAFFIVKDDHDLTKYPTNQTLLAIEEGEHVSNDIITKAQEIAQQYRFFHWHLQFPDVFEKGGFDCVLGNPPWEKINLKDEEFFATKSPEIAKAKNKSIRKKLIKKLPEQYPKLYNDYLLALRDSESLSIFFRFSGTYPLTGVSRINLYSVFAERFQDLINEYGSTGNVLPSGIIFDNNNKDLYFLLISKNKVDTVIDYENKKGLFPEVHRMYRFCLFVTVGKNGRNQYKFYQKEPNQASNFINILLEDIIKINPNTKTCPSFRNELDYQLAQKAYKKWNVLINEEDQHQSTWNVKIRTPFNMSNDSGLFSPFAEDLLPLYEAKYIYHYTHRYASWDDENIHYTLKNQLSNSKFVIKTQYYIDQSTLNSRFPKRNWCLVYRDITNATNERTMVASIIPNYSCGNTLSIIEIDELQNGILLLSILNSFIFDFFARQTVGGTHFNHWILKQLPVVDCNIISTTLSNLIQKKAFNLLYTAIDLKPMAAEFGYFGDPFIWDEEERYQLKCELDAIYGHLYGLSREEFDYILETFPIVKRKDIDKYGTYRTKETILKLFDEMEWVKEEMKKTEKS